MAAGSEAQAHSGQSGPGAEGSAGLQSAEAGGHAGPDPGRYVRLEQRPGQV